MLKFIDALQCGLTTLYVFVGMIITAYVVLVIINTISKIMANVCLKDKDLPEWEIALLKVIKKRGVLFLLSKYVMQLLHI
jgi:uncharacterized membrane protein